MNNILKIKIKIVLELKEVRTFVNHRIFSIFFPMPFCFEPCGIGFGPYSQDLMKFL